MKSITRRSLSRLKQYLPLQTSPFFWFMIFLQLYYTYQIFVTNDTGGFSFTWGSLFTIITSMFTVAFFFQLMVSLTSFNKKWVIGSGFFTLAFYGVLAAYHFGSHELLDWSIIADNLGIAFTPESFQAIMGTIHLPTLAYVPALTLLFIILEVWKKSISKARQARPIWPKAIAAIGIYSMLVLLPMDTLDPILYFFRTVLHYYQHVVEIAPNQIPNANELLNDGKAFRNLPLNTSNKKYVFFIMVESLNASALNRTTPAGMPYTPFLNRFQHQSVFLDTFYGNSVQTAKGHFAALFSVIPSISGKVFTKYDQLRISSVGSAFKNAGYQTTYYIAHHKKSFDNEYNFLTARGFDHFESVEDQLTESDRQHELEWGVEDRIFFQRFFHYFDQQAVMSTNKRQFFTLCTIANHFPFNSIPPERRFLYKNPHSIKECYANSVYLADLGLKAFFDELNARHLAEKSIVVITADHAFPLGEHGNYHLLAGYHEESFRIPLFICSPGQLTPRVIHEAHSQMDIAPTLLDLAGLPPTRNNFQGHSIFAPPSNEPIYLIQPYGKHLSVVCYPYKYRFYDKTYQEFAYNLRKDPMETTNIFATLPPSLRQYFRDQRKKIYINQMLIKTNAFWPPSTLPGADHH